MFDHSVGPSSAAPSVRLSESKLAPEARAGDVVFAGAEVTVAGCVTVSAASNHIKRVVAPAMFVGQCNVEHELVLAETDRLTTAGLTDNNFAVGGVSDSKVSGVFPVDLGGTGASSFAGLGILTGTGVGTPLAPTTDLVVDPATLTLAITDGGIRFVDPTDPAINFVLTMANGTPSVSSADGGLSNSNVALARGGVAPSVASLTVTASTDSNADLAYTVRDDDGDQRSLHVAWYDKASDRPRDPEEIASGAGAISNISLDIAGAPTGTVLLGSLAPISEYVVRCFADDTRGNVSLPKHLDFRTTEFGAPKIALVSALAVGSAGISFSASNEPDTSRLVAYAGAFLVANARTAADLYSELVSAGFGGLFVANVPANTDSNVSVLVDHYRDANDLATAPSPVVENETYYPFYLIVDAESNASLCNLPAIFYGNVPTWNVLPHQTTFYNNNKIEVAWRATDPSGIRGVYTYVGPSPVTYETLVHDGEFHLESSVSAKQLTSNNHGGTNLDHTTAYVVTVAAVDTSGLCNVAYINDARTLDDVAPVFDSFAVVPDGSSNAQVSWTVSDRAGVSNVYLVERKDPWVPPPTSEEVKALHGTAVAIASGTALLDQTPSWCNTFVFAVAEDKATDFGATANLLSFVSNGELRAPSSINAPAFSQSNQALAEYKVASAKFDVQLDDSLTTTSARVYLTLLPPGSYTDPESHSNLVFANAGNSAVHPS